MVAVWLPLCLWCPGSLRLGCKTWERILNPSLFLSIYLQTDLLFPCVLALQHVESCLIWHQTLCPSNSLLLPLTCRQRSFPARLGDTIEPSGAAEKRSQLWPFRQKLAMFTGSSVLAFKFNSHPQSLVLKVRHSHLTELLICPCPQRLHLSS